ncbi:MAG: hypothetical protein IJ722_05660 [Alloprevotella sp.]|nr:hypothetical protein [Alloprevotella sp.]
MIPKVIHYCWFGNGKKPKLVRDCIKSWKKYHPEWSLREWNEQNSPLEKYPFAKEAYLRKKWAFVSDVIRLHALYYEGGIYLDTDVEVLKPLHPLQDDELFMGYERDSNLLQTAVFGASPKNGILKGFLDCYQNLRFSDNANMMASLVNNRILSSYLSTIDIVLDGNPVSRPSIRIYPSDFFCPMSYEDHSILITPNTYCIHYYSFSWSKPETLKGRVKYLIVSLIGEKAFRKIVNTLRFGREKAKLVSPLLAKSV